MHIKQRLLVALVILATTTATPTPTDENAVDLTTSPLSASASARDSGPAAVAPLQNIIANYGDEPIPLSRCERNIPILQIIPAAFLPNGHLVQIHPYVLSSLLKARPARQIQSAVDQNIVINQNSGGGGGGFGFGGFRRPNGPSFINVGSGGGGGFSGFGGRPGFGGGLHDFHGAHGGFGRPLFGGRPFFARAKAEKDIDLKTMLTTTTSASATATITDAEAMTTPRTTHDHEAGADVATMKSSTPTTADQIPSAPPAVDEAMARSYQPPSLSPPQVYSSMPTCPCSSSYMFSCQPHVRSVPCGAGAY